MHVKCLINSWRRLKVCGGFRVLWCQKENGNWLVGLELYFLICPLVLLKYNKWTCIFLLLQIGCTEANTLASLKVDIDQIFAGYSHPLSPAKTSSVLTSFLGVELRNIKIDASSIVPPKRIWSSLICRHLLSFKVNWLLKEQKCRQLFLPLNNNLLCCSCTSYLYKGYYFKI